MKKNEKKISKTDLAKALRVQSKVRAGVLSPIGPKFCKTCGLGLGNPGT